jgi:hypothetical protein
MPHDEEEGKADDGVDGCCPHLTGDETKAWQDETTCPPPHFLSARQSRDSNPVQSISLLTSTPCCHPKRPLPCCAGDMKIKFCKSLIFQEPQSKRRGIDILARYC